MTANAKGDVIYATDEHDRDDLPWPVEADHWFWQTGDRWVAVVADWHEDWWEGSDPADIAARPEPWRYPINETPGRSGLLVFLDAAGNERTLKLTVPGATPERKTEGLAAVPSITVTGFGFAPVNLTYEEWADSEIQDDEEAVRIAKRMLASGSTYPWNDGNEPNLYREFDICNEAALRAALAHADQQEQDH